ncbi:hypothetical protein CY35_12G009900 [Sphagnum magellanicum]|nr:hypothetical protein CY35_12G009900 [Sphagnum magellanicum]
MTASFSLACRLFFCPPSFPLDCPPQGQTLFLSWNLVRARGGCGGGEEGVGVKQTRLLRDAAVHAAGLRARESLRAEPLFHDPYAACLAAINSEEEEEDAPSVQANGESPGLYELATRFIDDTLLGIVKDKASEVRQMVLLTDGMDTRPYRLSWPPSSLIFDVSPDSIYTAASEKLKAAGAKVPRMCLFQHISAEVGEGEGGWGEKLVKMGFRGDRPSVWAMQGLHSLSAEGLKVILGYASSMAMKDSVFVGEVPLSAFGGISQEEASKLLIKIILSNGFDAEVIAHKKIAAGSGLQGAHVQDLDQKGEGLSIIFRAKQLRLSDDQVEFVRQQIELAEEEGDEEGFEEW